MKTISSMIMKTGLVALCFLVAFFMKVNEAKAQLYVDSVHIVSITPLSTNTARVDLSWTGALVFQASAYAKFGNCPNVTTWTTDFATISTTNGTASVAMAGLTVGQCYKVKPFGLGNGMVGSGAQVTYTHTFSGGGTCTVTASASPTSVCSGSSSTLTASGTTSFTWSTGGTGTTATVSPTTTTTYYVTGTGSGCASSNTASVTVTVNTTSTGDVTPTSAALGCTGGSATFTATGGSSYSWSTGVTTSTMTTSTPGTYTVTITSSCGGTVVKTVTVSAGSVLSATITAGSSTSVCTGETVPLTFTGSAGTLKWVRVYQGTTDTLITTTATVNVDQPGSYYALVQSGTCSPASSNVIDVTVNPLPAVFNLTPSTIAICAGETENICGPAGFDYLWSNGDSAMCTTISSAQNLYLTVTDVNGCSRASSNSVTITVNPLPSVYKMVSPTDSTACYGGHVTISLVASSSTYLWNDGSSSSSVQANTSGLWSCTVKKNVTGCEKIINTSIIIMPEINAQISTGGGPNTICHGDTVTLFATPLGNTYTWPTGTTGSSCYATQTGNFYVTVTDQHGCYDVSSAFSVTVNPNPVVSIQLTGSNLTATPVSGQSPFTYEWFLNGTVIGTTSSIIAGANGIYSVVLTDANGCSGDNEVTYSFYSMEEKGIDELKIYPNPFLDDLHVDLSSAKYEVSLIDILGQQVRILSTEGSFVLQRENLPAGMYYLQIKSEGKRSVVKIIAE